MEAKEDRPGFGFWCFVSIMIAFLVGSFVGFRGGSESSRKAITEEAIKAGAAEYVLVDPATGKVEFRWKVPVKGEAK